MQTITKQQAAALYGNSYLLQDKEGNNWNITKAALNYLRVELGNNYRIVYLNKIGVDYFILARPLSDLTKEITHKGEMFVPILELAKIAAGRRFRLSETINNRAISICERFSFTATFSKNYNYFNLGVWNCRKFEYGCELDQNILFDKIKEWNFAINLPEGSWIPVTDNNNPYK